VERGKKRETDRDRDRGRGRNKETYMRTEEQPKPSDVHAAQTLLLWPLQAGRRQRAWVA